MFDLSIQCIGDFCGNEVSLLREDLLPIACGGNKVRIAQKLIEDAQKKGATVVVGYGNSRSNLCRVLSILCKMHGLRCVIVSPRDDDGSRVKTINSRIVAKCGADIVVCDKSAGVRTTIHETLVRLSAEGEHPYYINGDETGHGNEAVLSSAYEEVGRKLSCMHFDMVALAIGTGSTIAGLYKGLRSSGSPTKLVGVSIARDSARCFEALEDFGVKDPVGLEIDDSHMLGGYGKSSPELDAFVEQFVFRYGVFLDTTYVGKAFWGVRDYLSKCHGQHILFIHTGSLPLALDALATKPAFGIHRLLDFSEFTLKEYDSIVGQMPCHELHGGELQDYIQKMLRHGVVYVLASGAELKGVVGFYCNDNKMQRAYLSMISCDASVRGTGAAAALVERMVTDCRDAGMRSIEAAVVKENLRAVRFYRRLGFEITDETGDPLRYHIRLEIV